MLLLLLLLVVAASHGDSSGETYDSSMCLSDSEPYICGGVSFSYPFYLATERKELNGYQNSSCGYPGMGIVCDDDKPILQLDGGENYKVKSKDGAMATLADPEVLDNPCPRVDHNVTFAEGSWLDYPASTVDYLFFFLGCYFEPGVVRPAIGPITCQGFANDLGRLSFVIPDESVTGENWSQLECNQIIQVPVLKYGAVNPNDTTWRTTGYGDVLRQGFNVSWEDKKPTVCAQCEQSNGRPENSWAASAPTAKSTIRTALQWRTSQQVSTSQSSTQFSKEHGNQFSEDFENSPLLPLAVDLHLLTFV
jgi:hypothetical protein